MPERGSAARSEREHQHEQPQKTVDLYLFQSRSAGSISANEDPREMTFTNLLLMRRNGTEEAPELGPITAPIPEGKAATTAARKAGIATTHLRPQEASLKEISPKESPATQHAVCGALAATWLDIPFASQEQREAGEESVALSLKDAGTLFHNRTVDLEDRRRYALAQMTDVQRESLRNVLWEQRRRDARTKLLIIRALAMDVPLATLNTAVRERVRMFREDREEQRQHRQRWENLWRSTADAQAPAEETDAPDSLLGIEDYWREQVADCTVEDIETAFAYEEFQDTLRHVISGRRNAITGQWEKAYNEATGEGVPSMLLLFPLLLEQTLRPGRTIDRKKLSLLTRSNPTARRVLRTLNVAKSAAKKPHASSEDIAKELETKKLLTRSFHQNFHELSDELNRYFEQLRDITGLRDEDVPLDQLNEIKAANLPRLLYYATARPEVLLNDPELPRLRGDNAIPVHMFQWEAARKLLLLFLLNDAVEIQEEKMRRDIPNIKRVEEALREDPTLKNLHYTVISRPTGTKGRLPILRKMIVRDEGKGKDMEAAHAPIGQDTFAGSYVFDHLTEDQLREQRFDVPRGWIIETDAGRRLREFTTVSAIGRLIMSFLWNAQKNDRRRGELAIVQYKPLPKPKETIRSSGPAGGGDIRLAKFYLRFTRRGKPAEYKEVQVYVPDPTHDRSGMDEFRRKKADDPRYNIERFFAATGSNRSFMELLYPASIYGSDVRKALAPRMK